MFLAITTITISGLLLHRATTIYKKKRKSKLKHHPVMLWTQRRKQMEEISGGEVKSSAEKRIDRAFFLAFVNLGIIGLSRSFYPLIFLSIPIIIYTYIPTYEKTYHSIVKEKRITSYVLDSILITGGMVGQYFGTLVADVWMSLIGLKLIHQSENTTKKNLSNLFGEQPRSVWVLTDDELEVEIPFEKLELGDTIIVSAGQTIPIDGIIKAGFASIDQHKLTGESQPIEKGVGDFTLASTTVLAGKLYIEVRQTGQETVAMQIGQILDQTADFKDSMRSQGELLADRSVLPTLGLSLISLPILGLNGSLAVLANKFGNKMRVFGPASMLVFLNLASEQGILIKDGRSLELLNDIDTIVFDKTGTLTLENPTVGRIHTCSGAGKDDILLYAAAAEYGQMHPIARAIVLAAKERGLQWPKIEDARYEIGYGIQVNLTDRVIRVGSSKFMAMEGITIPSKISQVQESCNQQGDSCICVAFDDQLVGAIEVHATIRPEAKEIIDRLHQCNMSIYIISGDYEPSTKKLAQALGIKNYFANTLPENKAELIEQLQKEGKSVCFVGDGINDTIALKKANVSVSLSGATTVATDTAQIVLMDGTLSQLPDLFEIAQNFNVNMKHNLLIATVPTAISLTGIFFLHWGFFATVMISNCVLLLGVGNTMLPLFKHRSRISKSLSDV